MMVFRVRLDNAQRLLLQGIQLQRQHALLPHLRKKAPHILRVYIIHKLIRPIFQTAIITDRPSESISGIYPAKRV